MKEEENYLIQKNGVQGFGIDESNGLFTIFKILELKPTIFLIQKFLELLALT